MKNPLDEIIERVTVFSKTQMVIYTKLSMYYHAIFMIKTK